jgi:hypothetical protein
MFAAICRASSSFGSLNQQSRRRRLSANGFALISQAVTETASDAHA